MESFKLLNVCDASITCYPIIFIHENLQLMIFSMCIGQFTFIHTEWINQTWEYIIVLLFLGLIKINKN